METLVETISAELHTDLLIDIFCQHLNYRTVVSGLKPCCFVVNVNVNQRFLAWLK